MWYQWTKLSMLSIIFSEVYEPSHLGEKHRNIEDEKESNSWPRTKKNTKRHIQIIQKKNMKNGTYVYWLLDIKSTHNIGN